MRMRPSRLFFLSLVLAFGAADAAAQQRQITGRVTSTTEDAVVGASVSVVGTAIATATGSDGRFTVAAPAGEVRLLIRRIGFRRRDIPVPAGQSEVQVTLETD